MADAPMNETENVLGHFRHAETNVFFHFGKVDYMPFPIVGQKGDLVKVYTKDGFRYAYLRKTRAYVIVDEAEGGLPVIETWPIKQKKTFWVN